MKLAKLQETKSTIRFTAKLCRPKPNDKTGSWTLTLPKNGSAKLPSRGMTMVEGTIIGFPFRAALQPDRKESHWLRVNKTMRDAAGADAVDTVTVEVTRAGLEPESRIPMDISSAKQPETRRRRIEKACDMLASGKRRLCCFPGIKWLMKKHAESCGMWLPLPNSKIVSQREAADRSFRETSSMTLLGLRDPEVPTTSKPFKRSKDRKAAKDGELHEL